MNWRRFTDIASAQAYCDAQTALMGLPPGDTTDKWAAPMELSDGSFVVPAYQDDTAVPWVSSWVTMAAATAPAPVAAPTVAPLTPQEQFDALIAGGLSVTCGSTPAINGTYGVDPAAQANFSAVQTYALANGDFPQGATQSWVLMGGQVVLIPSVAVFTALASAAARFVAQADIALATAAQGGTPVWPVASVTLP